MLLTYLVYWNNILKEDSDHCDITTLRMSLVACLHSVSFGTFIKTSLINKQTKRNTCFTQYVTHKAFVLGSRTYKKLEVMLLKFKETWHIHFKKSWIQSHCCLKVNATLWVVFLIGFRIKWRLEPFLWVGLPAINGQVNKLLYKKLVFWHLF